MTIESLGASRTALLHHLKRAGRSTILELASGLGLNIETVREHMKALVDQGLVRRDGSRRSGPGRPEIVFSLTAAAEAHFPRREGETLHGLATHLMETANGGILQEYFEQRSDSRKAALMARVQHLEGEQRLEEVARFFSELGYMAEVDRSADPPRLRLCHCPLGELIRATQIPCRTEIRLITEVLGRNLARLSHIPVGDDSCSYRMEDA